MSNSMIPMAKEIIQEAKSTRFGMSIFLLMAIAGACYWAGRDSARGITEAQLDAMRTMNDERLGQVVEALKANAEISKVGHEKNEAAIDRLANRVQTLSAQSEVIRSHVAPR